MSPSSPPDGRTVNSCLSPSSSYISCVGSGVGFPWPSGLHLSDIFTLFAPPLTLTSNVGIILSTILNVISPIQRGPMSTLTRGRSNHQSLSCLIYDPKPYYFHKYSALC